MMAAFRTMGYLFLVLIILLLTMSTAIAEEIEWLDGFEDGLKKAADKAKPMFVQFTHAW